MSSRALPEEKAMNEKDKQFVDNITKLYGIVAFLAIFGFGGIVLGVWVQFFRQSSPGELLLNQTLVLYSMALILSAVIHLVSFGIIKRLSKKYTNAG